MAVRQIVFRCDAAPEIGSGHVMRCLTLAEALAKRGAAVRFLSTAQTTVVVPALLESGFEVESPHAFSGSADVLVVDHYGLGAEYERECRSWAAKILAIDDLADRRHDCDILLDQTYGRNPEDYRKLVPDHCQILSGPEYAVLRPQFAAVRKKSLKVRAKKNGKLERIFLFISGTDPDNVTGTILKWLNGLDGPFAIDVVTNPQNRAEIEVLGQKSSHKVVCHSGVQTMAALMAEADLAVGAGGTTSWERCCLGLPTVLVTIADNQEKIAYELDKAGAALNLGQFGTLTEKKFVNVLKGLQSDPDQLIAISRKAGEICDGEGLERIGKLLI